jgi:membrane fusion protein, heavy metal efflux system
MKRFLNIAVCLSLCLTLQVPAVTAQDHGHDSEAPTVNITQWSDTMELFLKYPEMIALQSGRFTVNLTILDGFQPVRGGKLTFTFTTSGGAREVRTTDSLQSDGVFTPDIGLKDAGTYDLELTYVGSGASSTFRIPGFRVHSSADDFGTPGHNPHDEITFLKNQQWKIPFHTAPAVEREIKQSIWAIGHVLPSPRGYVEITAPTDGKVQATATGDLAFPGAYVKRGEVVARIASTLQGDGWTDSRLALAQAERNHERARRLLEQDAISVREYEEAENVYLGRKAGHDRLAGGGDGGVLTLTAPIDGQIIDWQVKPGQRLQAGDHLMAIADPSVVWLKVNVYESDFRNLGIPVGAWINNSDAGWNVPPEAMKVLTTGGALDPVTRTVPVLLEIANSEGRLTINESTPVELYTGHGNLATAVPRSAVYEDEGLNVVFVQTGGESFAKRVVTIGPHHAGWVSILTGIEAGERVVTRGGYHVKLAATTAEIGHGHAH